jgi:3',5'-cyclic AMP phosphodiesterase CpdA
MKLVFLSDLHYGNYATLEGDGPFTNADHEKLAQEVHDLKPDILLVAGDCAETCIDIANMKRFLEIYKNPHGVSICIPGNHDMWIPQHGEGSSMTADEKYAWFYSEAKAAGWIGLKDEPFEKDGVWIVGNCGWYDFSTIDPEFMRSGTQGPRDATWYERWRDWSDYGWMKLDRGQTKSKTPMLDFCKARMAELEASLAKVPAKADRKALVFMTHIVGFERLQAWFRRPDQYRAYMGNVEIGKMAAKAEADVYYCGHTHREMKFELGNMRCINNGSGYGHGSKRYDVIELGDK